MNTTYEPTASHNRIHFVKNSVTKKIRIGQSNSSISRFYENRIKYFVIQIKEFINEVFV